MTLPNPSPLGRTRWLDTHPIEVEIVGVENVRTRAVARPEPPRPEPMRRPTHQRCALCVAKTAYRPNKRFCSERCRLRARYVTGVVA